MRGGVTDDLARCCRPILRGAISHGLVFRDAWTELSQTWHRRRTIKGLQHFCGFRYVAPLQNQIPLKAKYCTFYPPPVKIRRGMGEIFESVFRQVIYALVACFRFDMLFNYMKGDWGQK